MAEASMPVPGNLSGEGRLVQVGRTSPSDNAVYLMLGARVVDAGTLRVLDPWRVYVSVYSDIGPNRVAAPSIELALGDPKCPVYCNGEKFNPEDCTRGWEPHQEFMRWYAFTGACKVDRTSDGGYNFVSVDGDEREAIYRVAGCQPNDPKILANAFGHNLRSLAECRKLWAAEMDGKIKWNWNQQKYENVPFDQQRPAPLPDPGDPRALPVIPPSSQAVRANVGRMVGVGKAISITK
jgi:hypothetical protein